MLFDDCRRTVIFGERRANSAFFWCRFISFFGAAGIFSARFRGAHAEQNGHYTIALFWVIKMTASMTAGLSQPHHGLAERGPPCGLLLLNAVAIDVFDHRAPAGISTPAPGACKPARAAASEGAEKPSRHAVGRAPAPCA